MCAADHKAAIGEEVPVSCDGTWQRRGLASKNGVFSLLSADQGNSKVLDTVTMSSHCDACAKHKKKMDPAAFLMWKNNHQDKFEKNHDGPPGGMEAAGAVTAFSRSITKNGLSQ